MNTKYELISLKTRGIFNIKFIRLNLKLYLDNA